MKAQASPPSVHPPLAAPPPMKAQNPRTPPSASLRPECPGVFFSTAAAAAPSGSPHRRIGVAVDPYDDSAYAVNWAVANYLRPGDAVILLHVRPTSLLYGADWGAVHVSLPNPSADAEAGGGNDESEAHRMEDDYDAFTAAKADDLAWPLKDAAIPYNIHIVKDHDMKERLCLEVERLRLSVVIIGSARRTSKGSLGLARIVDYCTQHCICPVVVVHFPDEGSAEDEEISGHGLSSAVGAEDAKYHAGTKDHKKENDALKDAEGGPSSGLPVRKSECGTAEKKVPRSTLSFHDGVCTSKSEGGPTTSKPVKKPRSIIVNKKNTSWDKFLPILSGHVDKSASMFATGPEASSKISEEVDVAKNIDGGPSSGLHARKTRCATATRKNIVPQPTVEASIVSSEKISEEDFKKNAEQTLIEEAALRHSNRLMKNRICSEEADTEQKRSTRANATSFHRLSHMQKSTENVAMGEPLKKKETLMLKKQGKENDKKNGKGELVPLQTSTRGAVGVALRRSNRLMKYCKENDALKDAEGGPSSGLPVRKSECGTAEKKVPRSTLSFHDGVCTSKSEGGPTTSKPVKKPRSIIVNKKNTSWDKFLPILSGHVDKSASMFATGPEASSKISEPVFIIYDRRMMNHKPHGLSRERPWRISTIIDGLADDGLLERCQVTSEARPVELKYLRAVHTTKHIEFIQALPLSYVEMMGTFKDLVGTDILSDNGTKEAVFLAAGAVVQACCEVVTGNCQSAYAIVRPPGHHAKKAKAHGFCFVNNVAVGARYLQREHNIKKILVVDFDVHHGDGSQDIFYDDDSVLFISVHRSSGFPEESLKDEKYIGSGKGEWHNINVSLPDAIEDADLLAVWDYLVLPLAMEFKPEVILVSAGFDAALGDPIGGGRVTPSCFGQLVAKLKEVNSKIILVLEGGYNRRAVSRSSSECVKALLGDKLEVVKEYSPFQSTWKAIVSIRHILKHFWQVLDGEIDEQILARYKHLEEKLKDPGKEGDLEDHT
ncbi:unnamed protein product [Urochloa humidicola]